jgi:hypothetical protein
LVESECRIAGQGFRVGLVRTGERCALSCGRRWRK